MNDDPSSLDAALDHVRDFKGDAFPLQPVYLICRAHRLLSMVVVVIIMMLVAMALILLAC